MNVDFITAVKMFFINYANFKGRSTRAEFWWVALFTFLVSSVLSFFGSFGTILSFLFSLACLIPSLALATRRLHDTGRSGWLLVIFYLVIFACAVWFFISSGPAFREILLSNGNITPSQAQLIGSSIGGEMLIPGLVYLAIGIYYLVLMCKKSGPDNQYGPNPYGEY